ncbi:MAG: RNA-binding cell elongation regulator Jag/EloR [Acidimicrobiales bacterium]
METTGRTVEDAKEAALDQLGIDEAEAEFEVLEEPKTGLFGRVRGDARVRARVVPKTPRAKQERRPRRQRAPKSDDAPTIEVPPAEPPAKAPAAQRSPTSGADSPGGRSPAPQGRRSSPPKQEGSSMTDDIVSVATQADIVTEFLVGLVAAFGAEGTVTRHEVDEDTIELKVEGDDLGLLIGPKGQTLTAIHELSRTVLQRRATGRHAGRVRVDISGYRQRRAEALGRFAAQQAEGVLEEATARSLEPMNAADRKVVHDAINDIDGVTTSSEGVEPHRCVVILPEGAVG